MHEDGFGLSGRRITVSTAGVVPSIERLAAEGPAVGLAVSLNTFSDKHRDRLMPINRTYPIERVVAAAYRKSIGLVAAAGNAGPSSPPLYPAAYPEVIAVTATDGKREIYGAANRGNYISVSARGVDVLTAHVDNTYGMESGTSFAAAEVSGVVASLLEKRPKAGPEEIRAALQNTAAAVPGVDKEAAGFGIVNPQAAVAFVETSLPR